MKKLGSILLSLSCIHLVYAKEIICSKWEKLSDNPNGQGYAVVDYFKDESNAEITVHRLRCMYPGNMPCIWPKGSPCGEVLRDKKWVDDALELFSDDRTLLPVNGLAINSAINQLYDNGKGPATATVILGGVCSGSLQCL